MARITVEDCLKTINNRFDLILEASQRARELQLGATSALKVDNDKPAVLALREIAEGMVPSQEALRIQQELEQQEKEQNQQVEQKITAPETTDQETQPTIQNDFSNKPASHSLAQQAAQLLSLEHPPESEDDDNKE